MFSRALILTTGLMLVLTVSVQGKKRKNGERLRCDFEESMCRIKQDKTDDGRWIRWNGEGQDISRMEPPSETLNNNNTGYFMYAYSVGKSRLLSPEYEPVGRGGPKCLTFWYNIFGHRRSGTLSVYQSLNETYFGEPIWQVSGDNGNVWRPLEIDLTSDHVFKVVFEADKGNDISIAIDNVLISDNDCPGGKYSLEPKITCNFENEQLCGYEQDLSDDIDWKRYSAQDGVSGDGPDEDHTFGEEYGFYLCMDQRRVPKLPGHRARLISPLFNTTNFNMSDNDGHCIKFWYFLSGYEVGDINVYMYENERRQLMFNVQDDQSDIWHRAYFQVPSDVENFRVGFESVRGLGEGVHCIDDVEIFEGSCETLLTTSIPVITTAEPRVDNANCDFETDCLPDLEAGEWRRSHSSSHQGRRLPTKDHTLNTADGHYLHTSMNTELDRISIRTSRMYQQNHTKCMQFYYVLSTYRNGDHLNVYIDDSSSVGFPTDPVWTKYTSDAYSDWTLAEIDIPPTADDFSVVFEAVRFPSTSDKSVDVSIDDIKFFDQECSSVTAAPWFSTIDCDFESDDLCGYQNTFTYSWQRINGSTPSSETGPNNDHTFNSEEGHYMYMESSPPNFYDNRAILETPATTSVGGPMCLEFWYNMYGDDIGTLKIYRVKPSSSTLWQQSGNQGQQWKQAKVDINTVPYPVGYVFHVAFEARMGVGHRGDIAIDDVKLLPHGCSNSRFLESIHCDMENGLNDCGLESDVRYSSWKYYDYKSTDVSQLLSEFPVELRSVSNSFLYYENLSYGRRIALISSPVVPASQYCLSFSHIIRDNYLTVSIYLEETSEKIEIITLKKAYSPLWKELKLPLSLNTTGNIQAEFTAVFYTYTNFVALDNIKLLPGKCQDSVPLENLHCDFEDDCGFSVNFADVEDGWSISNKHTHSNVPLPSYDHTYGTPAGHYYLIRFGRYYGGSPRLLRTPIIRRSGSKQCLQFSYYMDSYKSNMMNVYVEDAAVGRLTMDPIWRTYGSEDGAKWITTHVDILPTDGDFSVVFEPIANPDSALGIDDVIVVKHSCSTITDPEWESTVDCDFENDNTCGYSSANADGKESNFEWQKNIGKTTTRMTGPNTDHTYEKNDAKKGNYMYIETSPPRKPGDVALFASPLIEPTNNSMCLEFWYSMFGEDIGKLEVYRSQPAINAYERLWWKEGQRSQRWLKAEVPLNTNYQDSSKDFIEHTSKIHFRGTVGYGYKGDIAIDDIKLTLKACNDEFNTVPVNSTNCDFENGVNGCGFEDVAEEGSGAEWNYFNPIMDGNVPGVKMPKGKRSFIYADASDLRFGKHATIMTPPISANQPSCLDFSHITTGDFVINIYTRQESGKNELIYELEGTDVSDWTKVAFDIKAHETPFKVVFEGVIGRDVGGFIALDEINIQNGRCPMDTVPVEKLYCDFEKDCRFYDDNIANTEDARWQTYNEHTPYNARLPRYDHTYGTPSGHYYFISFGWSYGDGNGRAPNLLHTPTIRGTGNRRCLQFSYYMDSYKSTMMNVYVEDRAIGRLSMDPIWRTYGSEDGKKWITTRVDIPQTKGDFSVVFEPIVEPYQVSAIGIDDVIILRQKCSKIIDQEWKSTVDCDFENSNCGYALSDADGRKSDFEWQKNVGMTKTWETGPNTDHTFEMSDSKQGNYMYIETSPPRKPGEIAVLGSPLIKPTNTSVCLEFWYSMFGEDIGKLEVYRRQPATAAYERLWYKEGQRSKRWLKAEVPLNTDYEDSSKDFIEHTSMIDFIGTVGYGYKGDIAIDDIKLVLKSCEPPKYKPPVPVNSTNCDFENGANECGFEDFAEEGSGAEWNYFNVSSIKFDPTIDDDDPRVNMSKGQSSFIFADASELRSGEHVIIMTPPVSANQESCMNFSYITTGDFIINIYSRKTSGEEQFIHQLAGEDIFDWTRKAVDIKAHESPFKVVFEGVIGRDEGGFLALDDINIQDGKCPIDPSDESRGGVKDLKDVEEKTTEDNSPTTVSTVVIALLTISLLIAFAVLIYLILVIKRYRQNTSNSNSRIVEDPKSDDKSSDN